MKRKKTLFMVLLAVGLFLAGAALALRELGISDSAGGMLMGVGSGLFTMSIAQLLVIRQEKKDPALARKNEISRNDERNIAMRNRAKALSGDALQWAVMATAWLSIGLGAPLWAPLLATAVFVAKSVMELYLLVRFQQEM